MPGSGERKKKKIRRRARNRGRNRDLCILLHEGWRDEFKDKSRRVDGTASFYCHESLLLQI